MRRLKQDPQPVLRMLATQLRKAGREKDACSIEGIGGATGTEYLGETMLALRALRKQGLAFLSEEARQQAIRLLHEVEMVLKSTGIDVSEAQEK